MDGNYQHFVGIDWASVEHEVCPPPAALPPNSSCPCGRGGDRAAASSGTPADRPSDPRTLPIDSGSWIAASSRLGPPHRGHTNTSIRNTRRSSSAAPPTGSGGADLFAACVAHLAPEQTAHGAPTRRARPAGKLQQSAAHRRPPRHGPRHRPVRQTADAPDALAGGAPSASSCGTTQTPNPRRRRKHPVIRHQMPTRPRLQRAQALHQHLLRHHHVRRAVLPALLPLFAEYSTRKMRDQHGPGWRLLLKRAAS